VSCAKIVPAHKRKTAEEKSRFSKMETSEELKIRARATVSGQCSARLRDFAESSDHDRT